jgi:2-polyprenyl-6-methoxyphenol hydroxylase-like FAD-dependent oxidoreductase
MRIARLSRSASVARGAYLVLVRTSTRNEPARPATLGGKEVAIMPTTHRDHAVVLGGSIAGLITARVLADAFGTVTIVERDLLPADYSHRRGVPHGRHAHGLIPRGRRVLEELLPGLADELVAGGGLLGDFGANVRWYLFGRPLSRVDIGLEVVSASRPLIEGVLRDRVRALPNVSILDGYDIVGLRSTIDLGRITGARVTGLHGQGSRILPADLVVDATGRGSRTPLWLTQLGYAEPDTDRVTIDLAYASRLFTVPPELFGDDAVVSTGRYPGQLSGSVMQRIEGGRVLVTLAGVLGERPPVELAGFTAYAQALPVPDTYEVIRAAQPIDDGVQFRMPTYVRHRYERLTDFPAGLLVTGDALCNFNPVYAQGMSVAALDAIALRDELARGDEVDALRYFAAASRHLDAPWGIGVGADLATPGVLGTPLPPSPLTGDYVRQLQFAALRDPELARAFLRVNALVDPPTALLRPEVVERVEQAQVAGAGSR